MCNAIDNEILNIIERNWDNIVILASGMILLLYYIILYVCSPRHGVCQG